MALKVPIRTRTAWISLLPQLLLMGLLVFVYYLLNVSEFVLLGALTYLLLSLGVRRLLLKTFFHAMKLLRMQNFEEAIPYFEKSADYFLRNSWLDKYRYLVLLSSSRISFREMSLCNIAYCYAQMDEDAKAKELCGRILEEYPDSIIARASLDMLNSLEQEVSSGEDA